jgi:hypothetical protein
MDVMKTIRVLAFLFCSCGILMGFGAKAHAQEFVSKDSELWAEIYDPPYKKPTEIPKGSELRKALFEQLRPKISALVGGKKILFSGSLKAYRNWAFFTGETVDDDGESVPIGEFGNSDTAALWLRTEDGWRLVDSSGGHSDVFYEIWPEQFGVPKALLGFD